MKFLSLDKVMKIAVAVSDPEYLKDMYPDEVWWNYEWNKAQAEKPETNSVPKKITLSDICKVD